MSQPDFSLSDEILAVIPTDPYEQLDLARKITSMAIASRVSNLESQVSVLTQKLRDKDKLIDDLEGRASSFERLYHEAGSSLKNALDENMKLRQERDSLAITAKKLGRDYAKLEAFKRQLMQSLNDENPSQIDSTDVRDKDENSNGLSTLDSFSNNNNQGLRQRASLTPPGLTPSGTPKMVSAGGSPRSYSAASSPKLFSGAASPTASQYDHIRMWSSSSQQSSVPNSPPRSHSTSARHARIDGKEFFRQARVSICLLESLFFTSLPPFISSRDSRDSRVFYFFFFTLSSSCFLVSYNQGFTDICKGVSKIATKAEIKSEMDYDTVHTMALLEAQREYMDMNDEDAEFDIDEEMAETETEAEAEVQCEPQATASTQAAKPQRKRRKTSLVWKDFVLVGVEEDGKERAKCIHCDSKLVVGKTHGTNQLKRHLEFCSKMPKKVDKHVYDHMVDREMVTESIIYHDLPFRYVEYEKVRERDRYLNPDVQHICRQTAALDVYRRYEIEKEKLKGLFVKHRGRVCLTADLWVARPQNMGYICLTGHYIDDGWRLHSKILEFCEMKSPHTGEEIANKVFESLKGWGLEKKVFSMTLDNATNNNSMLRILKGKLQMIGGSDGGLLSDGKHIHVRCCAHILNLIVKSGLALANSLLHNIRESVRYVKASPQRQEAFAACVERVRITSGLGLSLDVPTRWNSTYEMLFRALKFKAAFASMELYDPKYKTLPTEDEWKRGAKICDLLKPFSAITTSFSGSKYPTSNVYFTQVWRIQLLLKRYAECDDDGVREMAREMQVKFDKYWKSYSVILAMGAALDPRIKIEMLEAAYKKLDPSTSSLKIKELKDSLSALYKDYQKRSQTSSSGVSLTPTPQEIVTESPLEDDYDNDFFELEKSIGGGVGNPKTHLDIYLEEPRLNRRANLDLDVLNYWKENQHRFGDLASMARDILSIPITTVASESAFSIGSRVLTPYRNRLLPKNVQALLCTRNWLRGFAEYKGAIEDLFDENEDVGKKASNYGVESSTSKD